MCHITYSLCATIFTQIYCDCNIGGWEKESPHNIFLLTSDGNGKGERHVGNVLKKEKRKENCGREKRT